jgi:hypothetical protein
MAGFDHAPKHRYDALQKRLAFLGLDAIHPFSRDQRIEAGRPPSPSPSPSPSLETMARNRRGLFVSVFRFLPRGYL